MQIGATRKVLPPTPEQVAELQKLQDQFDKVIESGAVFAAPIRELFETKSEFSAIIVVVWSSVSQFAKSVDKLVRLSATQHVFTAENWKRALRHAQAMRVVEVKPDARQKVQMMADHPLMTSYKNTLNVVLKSKITLVALLWDIKYNDEDGRQWSHIFQDKLVKRSVSSNIEKLAKENKLSYELLPDETSWMMARKAPADAKREDSKQLLDNARSKCASCATPLDNTNRKQCGKCKAMFYCGRECQAKHWKIGEHKKSCNDARLVMQCVQAHVAGVI